MRKLGGWRTFDFFSGTTTTEAAESPAPSRTSCDVPPLTERKSMRSRQRGQRSFGPQERGPQDDRGGLTCGGPGQTQSYDGQAAVCPGAFGDPMLTRITFISSSLSAGFWKNAAAPAL